MTDVKEVHSNDAGLTNSFFSWITGKSTGKLHRTASMTDREQNLARTLELAQLRIAQLAADNDALNEAHGIVLETKESVLRSLSRQNTELSIEVSIFY